jgi:hypothetical protein
MSLPLMTANDAQNRLQRDGLGSLGLTGVAFAPRWANGDLTYSATALTLTSADVVKAPFLGLRRQLPELGGLGLYEVDGSAITGPGTVYSLHPEAAARLDGLVANRLGAAGPIRPVPRTLAIRAVTGTLADTWLGVGENVAASPATFSFHDGRGLIICPVAVAALFDSLATAMPALAPGGWADSSPGGVVNIAGKASGILVQAVDPHGTPFAAPAGESAVVLDNVNATVGSISATGLATLFAGQSLGASTGASPPTRLALGWARNSTLGPAKLTPPALPNGVALGRQFLRAVVVDLPWHLLGNRTGGQLLTIPGDDQKLPAQFVPAVRDRVNIDYLVDGADTLGAAGVVITGFVTAGQGLVFAVSPTVDGQVGVPPAPAAGTSPAPATHWPAFPAPPGGMPGPAPTGTPTTGLAAVWSGPQDVVVSFPGGTLPLGAHVRLFPRVFVVVSSIGPEPSFLRGDGGAALVVDANPFAIKLTNPLRLPANDNQPAGATLVLDMAVTDRTGRRRTFGNIVLPIGSTLPPPTVDQFAAPDPMAVVPAAMRGIAPSPVFGITGGPAAPTGPPVSIVDLLRRLAAETTPRIGPRLPTMARFPTIVVAGTGPTSAVMAWSAVVTGGHWSRDTRTAAQSLGNPGNPAGADVVAPGVRVDGALAFDAATIAMRRAQPILPFDLDPVPGWLPFTGSNGWVAPAAGTAPGPATCAGAVLRTVAVGCETPELSPPAVQIPPSNTPVTDLVTTLAGLVGLPAPNGPVLANETAVGNEILREFNVSKSGQRDALWSLRRAVRQARELVFVSSPGFSVTTRPSGGLPAAHEFDLVAELGDRMSDQPSLRVVVCTPRLPDMVPAYGGWVREALAARAEAVDALKGVDPDRVVAFHPVGFPGRAAAIRTTSVIVDDVWALVGTSHWRRRGLTFDEGVDVVGIDKALDTTGASTRIRRYRRGLLAGMLAVPVPVPPTAPSADWVRLTGPASTFALIRGLVDAGGLGRLLPFWPGPTDTDVLPQSHDVADPDGATDTSYLTLFAGLIGESPD